MVRNRDRYKKSKWTRKYCERCKKWYRVRRSTAHFRLTCPRCGGELKW